jgi:hypothetical protein
VFPLPCGSASPSCFESLSLPLPSRSAACASAASQSSIHAVQRTCGSLNSASPTRQRRRSLTSVRWTKGAALLPCPLETRPFPRRSAPPLFRERLRPAARCQSQLGRSAASLSSIHALQRTRGFPLSGPLHPPTACR